MLDADREKLHDKLIDLMVMRTTIEEGAPYVRDDGSFGLYCGDVMGGIKSAYHLIDALKEGGLFTGRQAPETDLDSVAYTFSRDKIIKPFEGVRLFWNPTGQIQVEVRTDKPLGAILDALDKGLQDAKNSVRRRFNEKAEWEDGKLRDNQLENMPSIFGTAIDTAFFNAYMTARCEKDLALPKVQFVEYLPDEKTRNMTRDGRLRHELRFSGVAGSPMHPFDFVSDLEKIFTGKLAVNFHQYQPGIEDVELRINGSNARLTADILDNDAVGARIAAEIVAGDTTGPLYKKILAEIDHRDRGAKAAQSLTAGTETKMSAMKPPKFRAKTP